MNEILVPRRSNAAPAAIDRRQVLQRIALMLGGSLSASTVAGVLGGCRAEPDAVPAAPESALLSDAQRELLATLAELILPETDTPGARGAGVPAFIEHMLADWHSAGQRRHFLAGLADVDARARALHGAGFVNAAPEHQTEILRALAEEAEAAEDAAGPDAADPESTEELKPFFHRLKELTVVGYYTSEVGMTQELHYQPANNAYEACILMSQVGRAWVS
jgi:hypothetical protein